MAILVCPTAEVAGLSKAWPEADIVAQPDGITTIATKRQWMMDWAHSNNIEKVLMMDDDLFFYYRYWNPTARFWKHKEAVGDWRLLDSDMDNTSWWIHALMNQISAEIPQGGFGPRQGNDKTDGGWLKGGNRLMLAMAYHVPTFHNLGIRFDRVKFREDFDVALQFYGKGLPSVLTNDFCVGQKSFAAPGGCTGERTIEGSDTAALELSQLHPPGIVRIVDRAYKGSPRKEVIIGWKRALLAGGYPPYKAGVDKDAKDSNGYPISGNRD